MFLTFVLWIAAGYPNPMEPMMIGPWEWMPNWWVWVWMYWLAGYWAKATIWLWRKVTAAKAGKVDGQLYGGL